MKFALSADDRPVLLSEIPAALLDAEMLGRTLARLLFVCDLLLEDSLVWLHPGARKVPPMPGPSRQAALLDRHADALAELSAAVAALTEPAAG